MAARIPLERDFFMGSKKGWSCPRCGSPSVKGHGRGRWICLSCGRTFTRLTGTVFASKKLAGRRFSLLLAMIIKDCTISAISECLGVTPRTAYIWRMKVFEAVSKEQDSTMLSGIVWIDETFVPVNSKDTVMKGAFKLRGVSRNQLSIACGTDMHGNSIAYVSGSGHITSKECERIYSPHIKDGFTIVHDGIFSHSSFIADRKLKEEIHKSKTKGANEALGPINHLCAMIQRNMVEHIGADRKYTQLYLGWVIFKMSFKGMTMQEKVSYLEGICCASGVTFRVKDRYKHVK